MLTRFVDEDEGRRAKGYENKDKHKKTSRRKELRRQKREGWR